MAAIFESARIANTLTSRRGARTWLAAVLLVVVALFGIFTGAEAPNRNAQAPADSESAQAWDLQFDAGIISVLVFGAGTNYALLLISRYREELLKSDEHRLALSTAWQRTVPAIIASNLTVVLALLTLTLAVIPGTRGLGVSSAIGLVIALAAALFFLPPLLAVSGRRVFWPLVPSPEHGTEPTGAPGHKRRGWRAIGERVVCRPLASLVAGAALLAVMATGLFGTSIGLDQLEKFRVQSESATGLQVLSAHFPPGEAQPITVVTATDKADDVIAAAHGIEGVVRAVATDSSVDGMVTRVSVTSAYTPGSPESLEQITELRESLHAVPGADAVVGGAVATEVDARAGAERDLLLVAPLILAVTFLVLLVLLRALVASVLLLMVNLASTAAAVGAGAWLSRVVLDQSALDVQVPLLAFLFLVALGIDYTIFLVHRFDSGGGSYAQYRPTYPPELAALLVSLPTSRVRALDVGCGTGQLTVQLAEHFQDVVGADPSASQLHNAVPHEKVNYVCAAAESLPLPDGSVDLIAVAQAAHWFDLDRFYAEARRAGRAGSVIALISYDVLRLSEPAIDERFDRFYREEIGKYWPPERRHVDTGYADLAFPFEPIADSTPISITKSWQRGDLLGYISTWSATRRALDAGEGAVLQRFADDLGALWPSGQHVEVAWPVVLRLGQI